MLWLSTHFDWFIISNNVNTKFSQIYPSYTVLGALFLVTFILAFATVLFTDLNLKGTQLFVYKHNKVYKSICVQVSLVTIKD